MISIGRTRDRKSDRARLLLSHNDIVLGYRHGDVS